MVPQQPRRRRRRAVLQRTSERRVVVARGTGGFGFTIAGQKPCVVSAVAAGGPAECAGLRAGDALLAVDGANVARAPHTSVARLVAAAPGAIALSVAPRESPPTDTEDTEPDERARTRRRHPPPRRRPHPTTLHHPGCHVALNTLGVNEILQSLSRPQLTTTNAARLECRAVIGYLGTIETPQAANNAAPGNVRTAVRRLRQERRPATPVLLCVLPNVLLLRRPNGQILAQYHQDRILYAGCGSDADRRYFGLVTSAETTETEASHSCHVFAVDPRMVEHETHISRAIEFQVVCTRDPVVERCLEFPPSAEYIVGVIRGMYSLSADDCNSPTLAQISKLAVKCNSPAVGNFSRCNRAVFRVPRDRRPCRYEERIEGQEFVANSPQPSNHSEITTTSSNSDSGIGFQNDCRNIADRILVVDFAGQLPPPNRFRQDMPRRPLGVVGCSSFDGDGSFLSNTTPVVDGFGGQGSPLNLDDVILNTNDMQAIRHVSPRNEEDTYNYNNIIYSNIPSTSKTYKGAIYDQVYTENEGHLYEHIPSQTGVDLEVESVTENFNSVEIYEEQARSIESVENVTEISGSTSKASADSVSMCSSKSHDETRPPLRRHLQASLDDMLVIGLRNPPPARDKDDGNFVHPASIKCKVRKSIKPLNLLSKTKYILGGKERDKEKKGEERRRAISASVDNVCSGPNEEEPLATTASEPDLRDTQSEQSSPFRRWTTGSGAGAGSSYRHDHRSVYNKQMSEGATGMTAAASKEVFGGVARWSLGLEHLLADPVGVTAFAHFLTKEFAAENIRFWYSCEHYQSSESCGERARLAQEIWQRHLADRAPEPVNVDAPAKRAAALKLEQTPPPVDVFLQAQKQIFNVMKFDSYPRFLRSQIHAECARADLCGQTPAFLMRSLNESAAGSDDFPLQLLTRSVPSGPAQPDSAPPKLKKSASNASERRRSGGVSLMPWRRTGSRDRAAPAPAPPPDLNITDVVKAAAPGQCTLCRVVLPDGATSVVEVDDYNTVRRLVDRLIARRNLQCNTYEVLLKEPRQGESRIVETTWASSVLGGREVVVERRCLVRFELKGRCVMVRCKPSKRLRHIVCPVLAKYMPETTIDKKAVLRDGCVVPYDTLIEELDGSKMVVVDQCAEARPRERRNDDAPAEDRLSEQPSTSAGACRSPYSPASPVAGPSSGPGAYVPSPAASTGSLPGSTSSDSAPGANGSRAGGRVRAALRPGPPLHHHPPDFLENLRETQRQRLQNKNEPSPAPRTPPPLPPKPARMPTLV